MSQTEDEKFFNLLVNISASSESSLERLSSSLKIFVEKYFDNSDFTLPSEPLDVVMECIMKSEAILYTVYELESEADTEDSKIELLYYKDLVMKTLVIITNLDFFVRVLKENGLFKDAYELREKVKMEFRIEAAGLRQDIESGKFLKEGENHNRLFKDVKPTEYRRVKNHGKNIIIDKKEGSEYHETVSNNIDFQDNKNEYEVLDNQVNLTDYNLPSKDNVPKPITLMYELELDDEPEIEKPSLIEQLKLKAKEKSKDSEPKIDKNGNKILRTAMGWEIPKDFFDKEIYS